MGTPEVLENGVVENGNGRISCGGNYFEGLVNGESEKIGGKEHENLGDEILEDFDTYWEDVNDRLIVSRMVSDSLIKGMVSGVEQVTAERITAMEMELANLKEYFQFHDGSLSKTESLGSATSQDELESMNILKHLSLSDVFMEHDKMRELLQGLKISAKDQFKKLKKGIDGVRGSSSIGRMNSGTELVGLGGILQENECESWVYVVKTLNNLKKTVHTIFTRMDDMLQLSKTSFGQWQEEHLVEVEIEAMVMRVLIQTKQEDFEDELWDQYTQFCGDRIEKLKEVSSLRKDLEAVLKSLSSSETWHPTSHGSHDFDHFLHNTSSDHVTSSKSVWEGNGKMEDSKTDIPENLDAAMLKHMSREEMVNYFNNTMTKMKRHHESILEKKTDEYFALRGEYLKLRGGTAVPHKKDKGEIDVLRKKIPEVILKLDNILAENEKYPSYIQKAEGLGNLKDRFDSLLSENCQLRESLRDKNDEVKSLLSQISDATEKKLHHSLAEANMLKQIGDLNLSMEELQVEASVREDVYNCFLRDFSREKTNEIEKSNLEVNIIGESYDTNAESTSKFEMEESELGCLIMQGLCGVIYGECIKEAEDDLKEMYQEYLNENEIRNTLEMKVFQRETELKFEVEQKKGLNEMVSLLEISVHEKEKLATDALTALGKERENFELVCRELNASRESASQLKMIVCESNKELEVVKGQLADAVEQIEVLKKEAAQLNRSLEMKAEELKGANHRTNMLLAISEERKNSLSLFEAKEIELRRQMETLIGNVHGFSKMLADFECRVTGSLRSNDVRLEHSSSQLNTLVKEANLLRRTMLAYQKRLDRRCSDLQMAEAEVDLLGDEVDTLLSLLEKIYIALDHYSPVLQHYPGIIEILKVIRRELSADYTKPVKSSPT